MDAKKLYVVIPNWNGASRIKACLDSLRRQSQAHQVIVVDNGSVDDSISVIESGYPEITLIKQNKNYGFTGGVNPGIQKALYDKAEYVALLNNDAVADKNWLKELAGFLDKNPAVGTATSKICDKDMTHLDSTGDIYTVWGLAFPRGRDEDYSTKYDDDYQVFAGSGGASMYRLQLFKDIGLFDQDFFAYYEDVDIGFRAQLAGWQAAYVPDAVVYHEIMGTSSGLKGFTTYQTMKNLPWLMWKNVPWALIPRVFPRFTLAYFSFAASAIGRGQVWPVIKGVLVSTALWPKKMVQRHNIQSRRKVSADYINSIITHDLPPNARRLRGLRAAWWRLSRKSV
jgi:GT2 family glycosyltransferase